VKHFVEWESIDLRIDGTRIESMIRDVAGRDPMIERIALRFTNGLLRVEGVVRKFIAVPFRVDVTRMEAQGTLIRVPLAGISAGPIPVPVFLAGLIRDRLPRELVSYEEPATLVVSLERFLPPFVTAEVRKIWIIDGGLAVTLGRGGADLPAGGFDAD
jgi:hypothetical protein